MLDPPCNGVFQDMRNLRFAHRQENHSRRQVYEKIHQFAFPITNKQVCILSYSFLFLTTYIRVDSRFRDCDNHAFLAILAPNFKFPTWLLLQNAEIWRNSSNLVRIFLSFCLHFGPFILFHSFNSINFCQSFDET